MSKLKQPLNKQNKNLKDFLDSYDSVTLLSALNSFDNSLGWEILKAYAAFTQRSYEVAALDKIIKNDELQASAYAAGYAKACEDLSLFSDGLRKTILDSSDVVENPRPEE